MPNEMTAAEAAEVIEETLSYIPDGFDTDKSALGLAASALRRIAAGEYKRVVHGHWDYTIEKGSCMDYHVTAKCGECGWDWFSKDGMGNFNLVFSAFITNGDSGPESTKAFLIGNAKKNNKLRYCPSCGALMDESRDGNSRNGEDDSHE